MGIKHSPQIVTNGLSCFMDISNRRSYTGAPYSNPPFGAGVTNTAYDLVTGTDLWFNPGLSFTPSNGGGINFGGDTYHYIQLPTIDTNENFTFNWWVRRTSINAISNLIHGVESFGVGYFEARFDSDNTIQLVRSSQANIGTFSSYTYTTAGTDVYISIVYSKTDAKYYLYINGVYVSSVNYVASTFLTTRPVLTSGYTNASRFIGIMYSFSYYNRVLTAAEILQNFNAHRGKFGL